MFKYVTEKPTLSGAWKILKKSDLKLNTKVLIWLNISIVTDFTAFKNEALNILNKDNQDEYCTGFTEVLKGNYGVTFDLDNKLYEDYKLTTFNTSYDEATITLLILLFIDNNKQEVLDFIRILDLPQKVYTSINDNYPRFTNLKELRPLDVQMYHSTDVFFKEENFRKIFHTEESTPIRKNISNVDEIRPILTELLLQHTVQKSTAKLVAIPTFKLVK